MQCNTFLHRISLERHRAPVWAERFLRGAGKGGRRVSSARSPNDHSLEGSFSSGDPLSLRPTADDCRGFCAQDCEESLLISFPNLNVLVMFSSRKTKIYFEPWFHVFAYPPLSLSNVHMMMIFLAVSTSAKSVYTWIVPGILFTQFSIALILRKTQV
jgi:hypothetical protein